MKETYVYAYFDGKRIPDVTSLEYAKDEGYVDVTLSALPDVFPDWFRSLEDIGALVLRMDNAGLSLLEFDEVPHDIISISSGVGEFPVFTIRFYVN